MRAALLLPCALIGITLVFFSFTIAYAQEATDGGKGQPAEGKSERPAKEPDRGTPPNTKIRAPSLISPRNGATLDNGRPNRRDLVKWEFRWSKVPGATHYHLFVLGAKATIAIIDDATLTAPEYRYEKGGYIAGRNCKGWIWRVRAEVNGEWGPWSKERTFDVEPPNTDPAR